MPIAAFALGRAFALPLTPVYPWLAAALWLWVLPQAWVTAARLRDRGISVWWALLAAPVLLFGALRWLAPDDPEAAALYAHVMTTLSVIGLPALLALLVICGLLPGRRL